MNAPALRPFAEAPGFWRSLLESPATVELMRQALEAGVVMDTWLSSHGRERLTSEAWRFLLDEAEGLILHDPIPFPLPFSTNFQKIAIHQVLLSSVLYATSLRKEKSEISLSVTQMVAGKVRSFAAAHGGPLQLVILFAILSSHESYQAIARHRRFSHQEFVLGTRHRPWSDLSGEDELDLGLQLGELELFYGSNDRYVYLNQRGQESLQRLESLLAASGWNNWQIEQQNISYIDHVDSQFADVDSQADHDASYHRIATTVAEETTRFLDFAGVRPGMRVLEAGCGTGRMTLDLGLVDRVLPDGQVVASDPSLWMLQKFHNKLKTRVAGRLPNLILSLSRAENLPFPDAAFDLGLGFAFLPYASDPALAVREIARVTRPGGRVATAVFLKWDAQALVAFRPWLQPIVEIIRSHHPSFQFAGFDAGQTASLFREAGLFQVETVPFSIPWVVDASRLTRFTMEMTAFSKLQELLPSVEWRYLLKKLEGDSKVIFANTPREERTFTVEYERVRGKVP